MHFALHSSRSENSLECIQNYEKPRILKAKSGIEKFNDSNLFFKKHIPFHLLVSSLNIINQLYSHHNYPREMSSMALLSKCPFWMEILYIMCYSCVWIFSAMGVSLQWCRETEVVQVSSWPKWTKWCHLKEMQVPTIQNSAKKKGKKKAEAVPQRSC